MESQELGRWQDLKVWNFTWCSSHEWDWKQKEQRQRSGECSGKIEEHRKQLFHMTRYLDGELFDDPRVVIGPLLGKKNTFGPLTSPLLASLWHIYSFEGRKALGKKAFKLIALSELEWFHAIFTHKISEVYFHALRLKHVSMNKCWKNM